MRFTLAIALSLALSSCSSTPATTIPDEFLPELSCFRDVIALIATVHPANAELLCGKIERGELLTDLERQLILEGIQRLRAAGKCLKS